VLDFLLDTVTDSPSTYLALCGIVFIDDVVPFAPGDTAMISAGILAANGGLEILLVILAGTIGGVLGDNVLYLLGRRFGSRLVGRFVRDARDRERYDWVRRQLSERGTTIIIVGRFIPAGRSVTAFACGATAFPYRRFLPADSVAALAWSAYTAMLGYLGGNSFRDSFWQPLLIGLGVALALGGAAEAVRRARARRGAKAGP
jgi:membrane protein DedA with SNARE-associated domain